MKKLASLTDWLTRAVPGLKQDPERLYVLIEKGNAVTRSGGPSFEYRFTAQVILLDVPLKEIDAVVVALIWWITRNQPELVESPNAAIEAIPFQIEQLDREVCDFRCDLQLTETVSVLPRVDGGYDVIHRDEPDRDPGFPELEGEDPIVRLLQLWIKDELVLEATLP